MYKRQAYYLQLMGHQTTVYEMLPKLGGMLRYGIPNYRLPKDRLDDDIRAILKTGVQVKNGLKIGQDITIQQLRQEYDVVHVSYTHLDVYKRQLRLLKMQHQAALLKKVT